jgi:hypothetical protein
VVKILSVIGLLIFSLCLFIANRQGFITDITMTRLTNVASIASLLIAVVVFFLPSSTSKEGSELTLSKLIHRKLLQKIDFAYDDTPTNHGWHFAEQAQVDFMHILDGIYGKILTIQPLGWYGLDFPVKPEARLGRYIEFVVKLEQEAPVYARVRVQSKNGIVSKNVWLRFSPGRPHMQQVDDDEWIVYVQPVQTQGGWIALQANLKEVTARTFGTNGWEFRQLEGLRVRGSLSIAHINVYK